MNGILRLAFKLLINDSARFTALLVGITFAVFLMVEMTSLFAGILNKWSSTVINIGAKIWVMDPAVLTLESDRKRRCVWQVSRGDAGSRGDY
jgi:putative ABC transport system permease protein